jgi:hypothetical protein
MIVQALTTSQERWLESMKVVFIFDYPRDMGEQ